MILKIAEVIFLGCIRLSKALLCLFFCFATVSAKAQRDSIALNEVSVTGVTPLKYTAGLYVQALDSASLQQFAFRRLDEILSQTTSLSFRNYGNGQLSTVSFRGLSSNHTAVVWNGVNINLPTLGQTDFSTVPVMSFDRLSIQYGAGATHLGSDAVGGSIIMESEPLKTNGISVRGGTGFASFGNWAAQAVARYRRKLGDEWTWAGKTQFISTDYPNRYPAQTFKGRRIERSTTWQRGFQQDLFLENTKGQSVSAHFWLNDHQMTLSPHQPSGRELTLINNLRTLIRYSDRHWQFRGSFIRDRINYAIVDLSSPDSSVTDRYGLQAQREKKWQFLGADLSLLAGAEYTLFKADVKGFSTNKITESRGDAFLLTRMSHIAGWVMSVNLRQAFVEGYSVPFTPSIGIEYWVLKQSDYRLKLTTSLARSYRVPTLNERYWRGLGNPDIRPESGFNKEIGVEQQWSFFRYLSFKSRLNAFHNKVDDWVYWNPAKNYKAENLQLVLSRGAEFHHYLSFERGRWSAGLQSLIGYTRSTQERAYDIYSRDFLGRQLRFVPVWVSNWNAFVRIRNSKLTAQLHTESNRYITFDHGQFLPAYQIVDVLFDQTIKLGRVSAHLQGRVANVANQLYLSVKSNAMPGRSYHINLLIDYHLLK